jgi:hypothetical protein
MAPRLASARPGSERRLSPACTSFQPAAAEAARSTEPTLTERFCASRTKDI